MPPSSPTTRRRTHPSPRHLVCCFIALAVVQCATPARAQTGLVDDITALVAAEDLTISSKDGLPAWPSGGENQQAMEGVVRLPSSTNTATLDSSIYGAGQAIYTTEGSVVEWTRFDTVVVAHAAVGSVAWMVISPATILLARFSTGSSRASTIAQSIVTSGLTIIAVVLGCIATKIGPSESHFQSAHQQMGLLLMLLLLLQLVLGRFIGSHRNVDVRFRPLPSILHATLSLALTALGFAQIWLGMQLYEEKSGRKVPLAPKVIWAVIVALVSILLSVSAVLTNLRTKSKTTTSVKEGLKRRKRKATVHLNKHQERGIRSDGPWVRVLGENVSGSTFVSSYSDATVFSEASKDPGLTLSERKVPYSPPSLSISAMWLNDLEKDMPVNPSSLPVFQPDASYSNRAPASSANLNLPLTPVSPLVPIMEEESEEEGEQGEEQGTRDQRPTSWISSSGASVNTEWSGLQSPGDRSRTTSIKRKPVPQS